MLTVCISQVPMGGGYISKSFGEKFNGGRGSKVRSGETEKSLSTWPRRTDPRQVKHISLRGKDCVSWTTVSSCRCCWPAASFFYNLWGGMNDSRVKWFLRAVDYETRSDGRYLSKRLGLELELSSEKLIFVQNSQSFYDTRRNDRRDNLYEWAHVA